MEKQEKSEYFLGRDIQNGERYMLVIPRGAIFAAENLNKDDFTFVSCATTPKFKYYGFRLLKKDEIKYPDLYFWL